MKTFPCLSIGFFAAVCLAAAAGAQGPGTAAEPNTIAPAEQAAGWRLLFDGTSTSGWRGFKKQGFPEKGWGVQDGVLKVLAGQGGGDIITTDVFADFELALQFRLTPKANSGIMFRLDESQGATWQTGPEFQLLDDRGHSLEPTDKHSVGALYDLVAPPQDKPVRAAGEWNDARIRLRHGVLQHFLNGKEVVNLRLFGSESKPNPTPEWAGLIAASKFKEYQGFGVLPRGHIALQEHGDEVHYRSIRLRDLSVSPPGEERLFNGKDLTGWKAVVPGAAEQNITPESVWRVEDGVLICKGTPTGYIRTERDFTNFILRLEWRFNPVTKQAGNSGVLVRLVGEDKVWPKSVEAQLQSGRAGDFWNIDDFVMSVAPDRTKGRNTRRAYDGAERPVGEWNEYEIIVNKGEVVLRVNGHELNRAWDVAEVPGKIALQSEGAEIHFRNIRLIPLP
jgi:hypothetical protein